MLVRVVAPHFVAGIIVEENKVIDAAPILRWSIGMTRHQLKTYFVRKGWKASIIKSRGCDDG